MFIEILFSIEGSEEAKKILQDLKEIPLIIEQLIKNTREDNKILAKEFKDENIFYCMGSGPNLWVSI